MRKAVFLDRDGVLNEPIIRNGRTFAPRTKSEFVLYPFARETCLKLKAAGYLLIVVTNQPDVGRGIVSQGEIEAMHGVLLEHLPVDDIEVCFEPGEESFYKKPNPGMVLRAAERYQIDLTQSFLVGDRWRDIDCGAKAGCRTIFIDHSYQEDLKSEPNFRVKNLKEAADQILKTHEREGAFHDR